MRRTCFALFVICLLFACEDTVEDAPVTTAEFGEYWYAGRAEVISYDLDQSRYGESRKGHAVLIFVTEPFSRTRQVKLDDPSTAIADKVTVMKLNMVKKFVTGIYPYSMMLSVFSPVDNQEPPRPLKITMSSQEWCGQVFAQLNRERTAFRFREFSYFESEGDNDDMLPGALLEDEIWNMIRLDPSALPEGEIEIYPGLFHTRLRHKPFQTALANASKGTNGDLNEFTLEYGNSRRITWSYEREFPFMIRSWTEEVRDADGNVHMTSAVFKKSLFIPYWEYNGSKDIIWRDSLGIQ